MKQRETKQQRIDRMNALMVEFKNGDITAFDDLLEMFDRFLEKQVTRWSKIYQGVLSRADAKHEAMLILFALFKEYDPDGPAYLTVLIERKLPLRLRYCFIKEIRRRQRDLSHSSEQMESVITDFEDPDFLEFSDIEEKKKELGHIHNVIKELREEKFMSDRDYEIYMLCYQKEMTHKDIAVEVGLSRSRVSRIINKMTKEIQYRLGVG